MGPILKNRFCMLILQRKSLKQPEEDNVMKRFVLVLLLAAGVVSAQNTEPGKTDPAGEKKPPVKLLPPRVRTGMVVKADFTTQKPDADSGSPVSRKSSSAWAVLTLQLDPGRAASVFDYVLQKDGTEYPCLDIAEGDNSFAGKLRIYSSIDGKKCRLVFAVPSAEDEYEMVFKLFDEPGAPAKLNVKPPPPPPPPAEKKPENEPGKDAKPADPPAAK